MTTEMTWRGIPIPIVEKIATTPDIPGYKIIRELGTGGMAIAYLAVQELFERLVALKVMMPTSNADQDFAQRFMREARIIGHLSHRNIVPVYEVGEREGQYFFSMEFLPDGNLESRIDNGLTLENVVQITSQVARALDYAHTHGVIHRDVKPDNILFRTSGEAVLTDFGIARDLDDSGKLTIVETIVGSPRYMSPEQAQGASVDTRSDIFSLGVVMYEMLTGNFPFDGVNAAAIAIQHVEKIPLKLPSKATIFQPLLDKMVTLAASDRYATTLALVDELDIIATTVGFEPVHGYKANALDRIEDKPTVVFNRSEVESLHRRFKKPDNWWNRFFRYRWTSPILIVLGLAVIILVFVLLNRTDTQDVGDGSNAREKIPSNIPPISEQVLSGETKTYPGPEGATTAEAFVSPGYYFYNPDGPSRTLFQQSSRQPILLPNPAEVYLYSDLAAGVSTVTLEEYAAKYPKSVFTEILMVKEGDDQLLAHVQYRAQAGEEAAQLVLSELTDAGWGVEENAKEALTLARQAARFDYALGHYQVATILMQTDGQGGEEAKLHLERAVEAGLFLAMNTLADIYWSQGGVEGKDRALDLYRKSAAIGDREAMFKAGKILFEEEASSGVQFEALTYLNRAAAKGHQGAIMLLRQEAAANGNPTGVD